MTDSETCAEGGTGADDGADTGGDAGVDTGTVAGVLLAAGASERFAGGQKLLPDLGGELLVCHAARALTGADLAEPAAVVDPASGVGGALADLNLALVANPDAREGQATSVRRGVAWARGHDAVVFALGDMPRVRAATVDRLVAAWRAGEGTALAAGYEGQRGNPVLFDRRHFDALAAVDGDVGGRAVFASADESAVVETDDPGVVVDVDTRADLDRVADGTAADR